MAFPCPQTELPSSKNQPRNPDLCLALYRRTSYPQDPGLKILGADFLGAAGPSLSSLIISPAKRVPQPSSPFNLSWHPLPPPRQGKKIPFCFTRRARKAELCKQQTWGDFTAGNLVGMGREEEENPTGGSSCAAPEPGK